MRITYLEAFIEIVRCGSFSEAAKKIGISQSAISQQITALEKSLSCTLLVRGVPGVLSLTPAGEIFLKHSQTIVDQYRSMQSKINEVQSTVKGSLSLAASAIPGNYLLPHVLLAFQEEYKEVDIRLNVANTRDVSQKLIDQDCEIGFIGAATQLPGYQMIEWVEDRIVFAVHPQHPFAERESIQLQDLHDQPLILREEGSGTRQTIENALKDHGLPLSNCRVALVLGSTQGVVNAIRSGLGIGFISSHASNTSDLCVVDIGGLHLTRKIMIAYDPSRTNSNLHKTFIDFALNYKIE